MHPRVLARRRASRRTACRFLLERLEERALLSSIWSSTDVPTELSAQDSQSVEVGVKFTSDVPGTISGIRFYKGTGNTGVHVGDLWSSTGTKLASAKFTNETASGWQQVNFATPVTIAANTTYIASYLAPKGHYSDTVNYFATTGHDNAPLHALVNSAGSPDGVYKYGASGFPTLGYQSTNYWVDVVFNAISTASKLNVSAPTSTTSGNAFSVTVTAQDSGGQTVAGYLGTVHFTSTDNQAVLPSDYKFTSADAGSHTFSGVTLNTSGNQTIFATDAANGSLVGQSVVSVSAPVSQSYTIWNNAATPSVASSNDSGSVELGVKFTSDQSGYITGIRFYKGAGNGGTHVGNLWTSNGTLLATATFTNETASGWQQVNFSSPVFVVPDTTYVASYYDPQGHYADDNGYFVNGVDNAPLHALSDAVGGGNGVYVYGTGGVFPTGTYQSSNYWVDIVFAPTVPTQPAPTVVSTTPAGGTNGVDINSAVTATFSEPMLATSVTTFQFVLKAPAGEGQTTIPATVTYNVATNTATLTPSSPLSSSTTYTATITNALSSAGVPLSSPYSWTFTTAAATSPPPATIKTDYRTIPNFGANPTVTSIGSGLWSSGSTWSTGQVPGAGSVVSIAPGTTVTYDANSTVILDTIAIQDGGVLQFATNVNTEVIAANYLVLPGGTLDVGTKANPIAPNVKATILIADQALNTTIDPEQYGDSLIGLGNVTVYGAAKTPFGQLATEPLAGATTLTFASPVSGWQVGDQLFLPDTRQLNGQQRGGSYVAQWEFPTIASVSSDGLTVTLTSPLQFSHLGARDIHGNLTFLPQAVDMTRNVVIASQNQAGNRGIVMFLDRANVDINGAAFLGLGRTTNNAIDNTTFNSSGQVTHIGTNELDRTPVQFMDLWGPVTPQANGYQYTFNDNVVRCIMEVQDHIWGVEVNNSSYGLIQGNFVDNWYGAGITLEKGTEVNNMIKGNFVSRIDGIGQRVNADFDGIGYWSFSPCNSWVDNVATDINQSGIYSYGFDINANFLGVKQVPAYQGADPAVSGQSTSVDMNAVPLTSFSGNEVYGATPDGLALWWIGAYFDTPKGNAGTVENFKFWNLHGWGYFGYETNNLVIDNLVGRGDPNVLSNPYDDNRGLWFADYMTRGCVVQNADLQNLGTGIYTPMNSDTQGASGPSAGLFTIKNSYLANVSNIESPPPQSVNGSDGLAPIQIIVNNDVFDHPNVDRSFYDITMDDEFGGGAYGSPNLNLLQVALVYNYNGISGDNFEVFPSRVTNVGTGTMPLMWKYVVALPADAIPPG